MNNSNQAWQSFWQQAKDHNKRDSGLQSVQISNFWQQRLPTLLPADHRALRVLELAAGDGALTTQISAHTGDTAAITCVDISEAALQSLTSALPQVTTLCADAGATGLQDQSFDCVLSQFGVEYAGQAGIREAGRLLAPGGTLCLVLHRKGDPIDIDSQNTHDALGALLNSGMIDALVQLARQSTALRRGEGSRVGFESADRALAPTVKSVEQSLRQYGQHAAGGLLFSIYQDVAHMYRKINNYDQADIQEWAETVEREVRAFRERMQSMTNAALDEATLADAAATLAQTGLQVTHQSGIESDSQNAGALAWILEAYRPS